MENNIKSEFLLKTINEVKSILKKFKANTNSILSELLSENNISEYGIEVKPNSEIGKNEISFNPDNQYLVDTNSLYAPYINITKIGKYRCLSIFLRKTGFGDDKSFDGNSLISLLKKSNDKYQFKTEGYALALLRRFVTALKLMEGGFDTIILTTSSNELNKQFFECAIKYLKPKYYIAGIFKKRKADDVKSDFIETNFYKKLSSDESKGQLLKKIEKSFILMNDKNNGIFTYHYLPFNWLRKYIPNPIMLNNSVLTAEEAEAINGKNVLLLDDTVTTGVSLYNSAEALYSTFKPSNLTFLSILSNLDNKDIEDPFAES